jgi:hypothetical protein
MFGFLKSKRTVADLARGSVAVKLRILSPESNPAIADLVKDLNDAGADTEAIHLELAAFTIFTDWVGAATALQKGKISEANFDLLQDSIWEQLDDAITGSDVDRECMLRKGYPFLRFAQERMQILTTISTETPVSQVVPSIVDTVCQWLCRADAPIRMKLIIQHQYQLNAGTISDILAGTKIVTMA